MGGRTMPVECEHGIVADYGDHGPDPDDGRVGVNACVECVSAELALALARQKAMQQTIDCQREETERLRSYLTAIHRLSDWAGAT